MKPRIPVTIIAGFLGSGKTTLLREWLRQQPIDANWAVVINEFGQLGVDAALLKTPEQTKATEIVQVAGGCLCCTTAPLLRVSLNKLIRQHHPSHLLLEPSGLGHMQGIIDLLTDVYFSPVVFIHKIITLVDMQQINNPRYREHAQWWEQMQAADVLVASKIDTIDAQTALTLLHELEAELSPKSRELAMMSWGNLPISQLYVTADEKPSTCPSKTPTTTNHSNQPVPPKTPTTPAQAIGQYQFWQIWQQRQGSTSSLSYTCHTGFCLPNTLITALMQVPMANTWRLKAVLHTDSGWQGINRTGTESTITATDGANDNRIEIIVDTSLIEPWLETMKKILV